MAEGLRAHHATYILSIGSGNGSSSVTGADGLMIYDLKNTCDGWATDLKLKLVMGTESGEGHGLEISQVTWESKDSTAYRYVIKNGDGNGRAEQMRGEARKAGGKVTVTADQPAQAQAELPDDTLFPLAHTRELLKQAAAGETVFTANYFDGTASTEAMQASAVIGTGETDWSGLPKPFPALKGVTSYPVGLAFYQGDQADGTPDSEQTMRLYDNGVIGALTFSLGNIKIRAVLDSLQLLPDSGC
ncbi:EipB family protein [Dongia sedimenti]|uniref:DUF1849 family protein n=1 Tax=Dongia sedimenti TaxID=3064282 RepID=A0ABU0YI90_9PROT|nr:DUF1849 family protein [Rhodospirillaceae bacterium R-7]